MHLSPNADDTQTDGDIEPGDKPPQDLKRPAVASPSSERTISPPYKSGAIGVAAHALSTSHTGSTTPPSMNSPSISTESDGDLVSPLPSRTASRRPSETDPKALGVPKQAPPIKPNAPPAPLPVARRKLSFKSALPLQSNVSARATQPPSVAGSDVGHKFNLKDLLGGSSTNNGVARKASQRSAGSRRSEGSAAESAMSLNKKYGVCDRVAIGKGATSVVRLVHKWDRSEEKLYAVKEFRKRRKNESEKDYVKKLTAEFCISSTLRHRNIVETVDLLQDEQQRWCEVMEYCPGGDLYAAIKKGGMSASEIACCFRQMLFGVEYLHGQGVAHRDIKPENVFFDAKGGVKIGDYGASTVYRLPWETTVHFSTGLCGSEPYIAPEQFLGKPYDARLVDIWACGIVYYCMQSQELPWRAAQATDQLFSAYCQSVTGTRAENATPPMIATISPRPCRPVLRKMLEPDPRRRWDVKKVLADSWIEEIEICTVTESPTHVHSHARALVQAQIDKANEGR